MAGKGDILCNPCLRGEVERLEDQKDTLQKCATWISKLDAENKTLESTLAYFKAKVGRRDETIKELKVANRLSGDTFMTPITWEQVNQKIKLYVKELTQKDTN